MRFFPHK